MLWVVGWDDYQKMILRVRLKDKREDKRQRIEIKRKKIRGK